jgi:very-short-patch-repair endonuclease
MKQKNIDKCRKLRRNQTDAEKKLWKTLRNRQLAEVKFRRQFSIGGYILDFYCPEYRLGIEADGRQHYQDEVRQQDETRTRELSRLVVEIIRFNDREILSNIEGVYEIIKKTIEKKRDNPLTLILSPKGRGSNSCHD